jgi:hypothetical protein
MMISGQNPEHFAPLSAGCASQGTSNQGLKVGLEMAYPQPQNLFFCLRIFPLTPLPLRPQNIAPLKYIYG